VASPRRIIRNETHLITRRCYQRTFRLRPSPETNQIFVYCVAFAEAVAAAREDMRSKGREVLGRNVVLSASFAQRAKSYEEKRGTIPTFAARKKSVRDQLRRVEQHFRRQYRAAFERWRRGDRAVEFPDGTWGMCVVHAASIAPPLAA
jgi:Ni/Co efflux regulator RcnB